MFSCLSNLACATYFLRAAISLLSSIFLKKKKKVCYLASVQERAVDTIPVDVKVRIDFGTRSVWTVSALQPLSLL